MKDNRKMEPHYKDELLVIIKKQLPNCKIWLFGSRARGTHKSGADVDLAIDAGRRIGIKRNRRS